ncbi:unnamed protein product [Symbiodinium natans]|uniref:Uncharacterized protein n=1 Tax=Symbiodinium natans TaxID=878477 RepID=A0A812VFI9_9DINO|nr:unnamed protein product [Symbiodinium natans]
MPAVTYGSLLTYGPIMAKMDHVKPQSCSVAVPCAKDAWMQEWALKSLNVQSDSGSRSVQALQSLSIIGRCLGL